ncbi:unnamed protein product [Lampetra fluviatilis]
MEEVGRPTLNKASPAKDRRAAFVASKSLHKTEVGEEEVLEEVDACQVAEKNLSNGWTQKPENLSSHSVENWLTNCVPTGDKNGNAAQKGANQLKPGSNIEDDLLLGAEAQNLCGSKAINRVLNSGERVLDLPKTNKKKVGFHNMGQSFNSSSSGNTISSVCELLDLCEENPEEILYNLGFGHDEPDIASKIPPRFFSAPSQATGIDFRVFLQCQLLRMDRENPTLANRFRQVEVFATVADAFSSLYSRVSGMPVDMIMKEAAGTLPSTPETEEATGGVTVKAATKLLNTVRTRRSLSSPSDMEQKRRTLLSQARTPPDSASAARHKKSKTPAPQSCTTTAMGGDEQCENNPAGRIRQLREDNLQRLSTRLSERLCLDPLTEEVIFPASEDDTPVFMSVDTSLPQPDLRRASPLETESSSRHYSSPCEVVTVQSDNSAGNLEQDEASTAVADMVPVSDRSTSAGGVVCGESIAGPKTPLHAVACPERKEWPRKPLTSTPDTEVEPSHRPPLAEAMQKESFDIEEIQSNEDEGAANVASSFHHTLPKCKRGLYAGEMLLRANSGQSDSSGFEDINTECIAMTSIQTHSTYLGKMGSSAESFDSQTTLTLPSETQPSDVGIAIHYKPSVSAIYSSPSSDTESNPRGEGSDDDNSVADKDTKPVEIEKCKHDHHSCDSTKTDAAANQCAVRNAELNTNTSPALPQCEECIAEYSPHFLQKSASITDSGGSKRSASDVLQHCQVSDMQYVEPDHVIYNESLKLVPPCVGLEIQGSVNSVKNVAGHNSPQNAVGNEMASDKGNSRASPEKESFFNFPMSASEEWCAERDTAIAVGECNFTPQPGAEGHDGDDSQRHKDMATEHPLLAKSHESGDAQTENFPINENIESALQRLSFRKAMKQPVRTPQGSNSPFGVDDLMATVSLDPVECHDGDSTLTLEHAQCPFLSPTKVVSTINIQMTPDHKMSCSPVAFTFKYNTTEEDKPKEPIGMRKPRLIKQMSAPVLDMTHFSEDVQQTLPQAPVSLQDRVATTSCRSVIFVPQHNQPIDHTNLYRTVSLDAGLGCNTSPLQRAQSCQNCCFQCHRPIPCCHALQTQAYCPRVRCSSVCGQPGQFEDFHSHPTTPGVTSPLYHFPMRPSLSRPEIEAELHKILFDIRTSTNKLSTFDVQNMHMLVELHALKQNVRHFHVELTELEIGVLSQQASIRRPLSEQERLQGEHLRGLRWMVRKELMELEGRLEERTRELELHQETSNFRSSFQSPEARSPSLSRTLSGECSPSIFNEVVVDEVDAGCSESCESSFPSAEAECDEGASSGPEPDMKKEFASAKEIAKVLHEIKESVVGEIRRELVEKLLPIFKFSTKPVHPKNTDGEE